MMALLEPLWLAASAIAPVAYYAMSMDRLGASLAQSGAWTGSSRAVADGGESLAFGRTTGSGRLKLTGCLLSGIFSAGIRSYAV